MDTNVPTPFPLIHVDLNHDPHEFFFPDHLDRYQSSRYALFPQPQGSHHPNHHNSVEKLILSRGSPHDHLLNEDVIVGKCSIYGHDHDHGRPQEYCSVKWMSSKTMFMKKMTGRVKPSAVCELGSDPNNKASSMIPMRRMDVLDNETSSSANSNRSSGSWIESKTNTNNNPIIIRVCTDCNATKTPLWRSGPTGPKVAYMLFATENFSSPFRVDIVESLCNACGMRQRKARRAMAAAVPAVNGECPTPLNPAPTKVQLKKKNMKKAPSSSDNDPQPIKKLKTLDPSVCSMNLCFEEFLMKLSEWISDFRGVFPQEEKEAAILLMALSCGLVQADNLS